MSLVVEQKYAGSDRRDDNDNSGGKKEDYMQPDMCKQERLQLPRFTN